MTQYKLNQYVPLYYPNGDVEQYGVVVYIKKNGAPILGLEHILDEDFDGTYESVGIRNPEFAERLFATHTAFEGFREFKNYNLGDDFYRDEMESGDLTCDFVNEYGERVNGEIIYVFDSGGYVVKVDQIIDCDTFYTEYDICRMFPDLALMLKDINYDKRTYGYVVVKKDKNYAKGDLVDGVHGLMYGY